MSQWGEERRFHGEPSVEIIVLPSVDTDGPFEPINLESKIDYLGLMNIRGDRQKAEELFERVKQQYIGRPYAEWRRPGPPRPLPMEPPMMFGKRKPPDPPSDTRARAAIETMRQTVTGHGTYEPIPCKIRQWSDMTGCETPGCGLRWDTGCDDPPRCPRLAVARGRVALGRHYPNTPSPSAPETGFLWALWLSVIGAVALVGRFYGVDIVAWLKQLCRATRNWLRHCWEDPLSRALLLAYVTLWFLILF